MAVLDDSLRRLTELSATHDRVLLFYSGGKDSLASLDLCCRVWGQRRVVAVHMYFVPGLAVVEDRLSLLRERFPDVRLYFTPHWMIGGMLRYGIYTFPRPDVPDTKLAHVYAHVRQDLGVRLVAMGGKLADSRWRRQQMKKKSASEDVAYPVRDFNKWDVLAYLKTRGLPAPETFDLDLSIHVLLWLHDEHPDDFRRVCEFYPFAEAVVRRREYYGVTAARGGLADSRAAWDGRAAFR